jgi:hypothetical protein
MNTLPPLQIWPVIHLAIESRRAILQRNIDVILSTGGCAGVFLIQMNGYDHWTMEDACWVREQYPELAVGVNLLSTPPWLALEQSLAAHLAATWTDAPGVTSAATLPIAIKIRDQLASAPEHLFFGSVAFKYQRPEPNPAAAAVAAADLGMLATTSGAATGQAPELAKLKTMRAALGQRPLAVASGISPDNISELGSVLTHVLVSTGISRSFYELDAELLASLVREAKTIPRSLPD